jgi:hypothetical protein
MGRKEQHVVKTKDGWDVKKPHAERASALCDSKAEAVDLARDISKGYTLVTRRGYVVHLESGKEGIHKKFDEVLRTSHD